MRFGILPGEATDFGFVKVYSSLPGRIENEPGQKPEPRVVRPVPSQKRQNSPTHMQGLIRCMVPSLRDREAHPLDLPGVIF